MLTCRARRLGDGRALPRVSGTSARGWIAGWMKEEWSHRKGLEEELGCDSVHHGTPSWWMPPLSTL